MSCPFHDDPQPSCKIYPDHFYCYGCGERGDRIDWLTRVEGMTRAEAMPRYRTGPVRRSSEQQHDTPERLAFALRLWDAALAARRHPRRALSGRDPRHRRDPAAADNPRGAALPSQLSLRGESTPPLHRRPHARPA